MIISRILQKTTLPLLSRRLNQDSARQKVIAHNIANVNTVGYRAKDIEFSDILHRTVKKAEMTVSHRGHIKPVSAPAGKVINIPDTEIKNGINNVDIDEQMVELARNQLDFEFSATHVSRLFNSLRASIRGRL